MKIERLVVSYEPGDILDPDKTDRTNADLEEIVAWLRGRPEGSCGEVIYTTSDEFILNSGPKVVVEFVGHPVKLNWTYEPDGTPYVIKMSEPDFDIVNDIVEKFNSNPKGVRSKIGNTYYEILPKKRTWVENVNPEESAQGWVVNQERIRDGS